MDGAPEKRVSAVNSGTARPDGEYVPYLMIAVRRIRWSFALQQAFYWCERMFAFKERFGPERGER
jgi:hypothetical protein